MVLGALQTYNVLPRQLAASPAQTGAESPRLVSICHFNRRIRADFHSLSSVNSQQAVLPTPLHTKAAAKIAEIAPAPSHAVQPLPVPAALVSGRQSLLRGRLANQVPCLQTGAVKKTAALGKRQAQPTQLPLGLCAKGLSACPVKRNGIDVHECIDLANDIEHCGSCRNSCDDLDDGMGSLTCSQGKCVPHNTDGTTRTLAYRSTSPDDVHILRKKRGHSRTATGNNVKPRVRAVKPKRS